MNVEIIVIYKNMYVLRENNFRLYKSRIWILRFLFRFMYNMF